MQGPAFLVVSYLLGAVFVVAFVVRSVRLARLPVHLRWELAPVPHERGKGHYGGSYFEEYEWWTKPRAKSLLAELKYMAREIVFLHALWSHNRALWWFSFPFHFGLYLLVTAAAVLLLGAAVAGVTGWTWFWPVATVLAGVGYGLGALGAAGLVVKRAVQRELGAYTTREAWLNLGVVLLLFGSGLVAVATAEYAREATGYIRSLATADGAVAVSAPMAVHLLAVLLFLAWLPFSRMMHFVAKYFTYHQVRWDDAPLDRGSGMERELEQLLQQKLTWSAPHVRANGGRSWAEVASEEVGK